MGRRIIFDEYDTPKDSDNVEHSRLGNMMAGVDDGVPSAIKVFLVLVVILIIILYLM